MQWAIYLSSKFCFQNKCIIELLTRLQLQNCINAFLFFFNRTFDIQTSKSTLTSGVMSLKELNVTYYESRYALRMITHNKIFQLFWQRSGFASYRIKITVPLKLFMFFQIQCNWHSYLFILCYSISSFHHFLSNRFINVFLF